MEKYTKYIAILLVILMLFSGCASDPMYSANQDATLIVAPENTEPENTEPENTEPENTTPENTEPENTTPENTEPENTEPENTEPENTEPENTEPENTTPENTEPENTGDEENWTTSCMTFNVLQVRNPDTNYADPEVRAPWILDTIVRYDPDLLGLQEVTHDTGSLTWDMHDYLIENLTAKGYDVNGLMDSKDKAGSNVAIADYHIGSGLLIMWKKDRFELKDYGAQAYSNDKDRHYQWVKLYDKQEDITILMTNTHMSINPKTGNSAADATSGDAIRAKQAQELYFFWTKNCTGDMALYATGDYNHGTSSQAFANMTQGQYVSTREYSQKANAESSIDHVLINGDIQDCYEYHRCDETYEGGVAKVPATRKQEFAPSDHYAVIAYCSNAYRA